MKNIFLSLFIGCLTGMVTLGCGKDQCSPDKEPMRILRTDHNGKTYEEIVCVPEVSQTPPTRYPDSKHLN